MMKKTFLFILTITIFNTGFAQNKGIFLVDSLYKTPIPFVLVQSDDFNFSQSSDENGYINLSLLPKKCNTILISCIGYKTKKIIVSTIQLQSKNSIVYLQKKFNSLNDVVIKANSKTGIFKTISDLDIHLRPINNSQEVLRMVPGLFIGQHAGGGKAEQIFLRGFDLDHGTDINISVDGMPVNMVSHSHGQGYADLHFLIPELIHKVNFNKGPYFADKGNFTTAGYVEFKTKDYLENNILKLEVGQFNTFRTIAAINLLKTKGEKRNRSLYFAQENSFTKGYFDSPQNFSRFNNIIKYKNLIDSNNTITALISSFTSKWNASGQIPNRAVENGTVGFFGAIDNTEGGKTSRFNANIELLTKLNNGATLKNQLFYSKYLFELYSNFTFFKEDSINGDQIRQKENRNIIGYNNVYEKEFYIGKIKSAIRSGLQIRLDDIRNIELTRTKDKVLNTKPISLGNVTETNLGAFYSQKIFLSKKLELESAIRYDWFSNKYYNRLDKNSLSTDASIVSPKLNLNYILNKKVQLYLYNGKGFHSNDTRVAVQQNGEKVLPPAYGTDLGGVFKVGKKIYLQTAFWYLWLDQEFIYVGDEGVVEAGGQTKRFGLDASIRYEVAKNLYADLDISLANPRAINVAKNESYLPIAPRFTSIGGLTYRKEKGWNGSLRYRYMANRPANNNNTVIAKSYFVTDAAINFTSKKWEFGLSIQNLFNVKWKETQFDTESRLKNEQLPVSEIHYTPGTPFSARLSLTVFL